MSLRAQTTKMPGATVILHNTACLYNESGHANRSRPGKHSPLYDRYVKNGSLYAAKRNVEGLLDNNDNKDAKNARFGVPRWCKDRWYSVLVESHANAANAPPINKSSRATVRGDALA